MTTQRPSSSACGWCRGSRSRNSSINMREISTLPSTSVCLSLLSLTKTNKTADERYIFSNQTKRYHEGKVAPGPEIRSNAAREMASTNLTSTAISQKQWLCKSLEEAKLRYDVGLDTYRYIWAGTPPPLSPSKSSRLLTK